jgi:LmbE family N-acetylglucosaminyl deacetylase
MQWIYLSPHFDDAAFSCGGLIWEQVQKGDQVSILTVCAGEPPAGPISAYAQSLHKRWETGLDAVAVRREENLRSCQILGTEVISLTIPDVIYRRSSVNGSPICESDAGLFAELRPEEYPLVDNIMNELDKRVPLDSEIVSPLALGGHVDHHLVRTAVEKLGRPTRYYADFPYLIDMGEPQMENDGEMAYDLYPISGDGLAAWQASIELHSSQLSTFWNNVTEMRSAVRRYWEPWQGLKIWHFR